jgi:hypothetical protein
VLLLRLCSSSFAYVEKLYSDVLVANRCLQNYGFNKPTFLVFPENFLERKKFLEAGGRTRRTNKNKQEQKTKETRTNKDKNNNKTRFCCQKWEIIKIL